MSKRMTFHESYGELPAYVLALYRRNNVSVSDHDMLVDYYGNDWYRIALAVRKHTGPGGFVAFSWMQEAY